MKEMKHTPGPWVCQTQANGSSIRHPVILSDDGAVATAQWCDNTQKTNANASMIAASPTMYGYINQRANEGDADAAKIIASI